MPKLIRDLIPIDMRSHGYTPKLKIVDGDELLAALFEKLKEETAEACAADPCDFSELADVLEIVRSIAAHKGVNLDTIIMLANDKRDRRGGFECGFLWLDSDTRDGLDRRHAEDEYRKAEEARRG